MRVKQLDHLNLTVTSLEATIDWYGRVFGFERLEHGVQDGVPWAVIKGGEAMLCIYEYQEQEHLDRFRNRARGLHGMSHFALRIVDEVAWLETIEEERLELSYGGIIEWPHSKAWYVTDPTGYEIEVALWENDRVAFG